MNELARALDMEETIASSYPKMISKSSDAELRGIFRALLRETETHIVKLKRILRDQGSETCKVSRALASGTEDLMKDVTDRHALDIALTSAAQQMAHHQIAIFRTLKSWALVLGHSEATLVLGNLQADGQSAGQALSLIIERLNVQAPAIAA